MTAVVPVKSLAHAKSRLSLPAGQRRALALAFALDTLSALTSCPLVSAVVVVTSDPAVAHGIREYPVRLVPDAGGGLDVAARDGIRAARSWARNAGVVVVPADLPFLRPSDVTSVLTEARVARGAFVPDRSSTGTTLVVYRPGEEAVTRYGAGSASRHRTLGLHVVDTAPPGARHDVDTLDDLLSTPDLVPGRHTAALVSAPG